MTEINAYRKYTDYGWMAPSTEHVQVPATPATLYRKGMPTGPIHDTISLAPQNRNVVNSLNKGPQLSVPKVPVDKATEEWIKEMRALSDDHAELGLPQHASDAHILKAFAACNLNGRKIAETMQLTAADNIFENREIQKKERKALQECEDRHRSTGTLAWVSDWFSWFSSRAMLVLAGNSVFNAIRAFVGGGIAAVAPALAAANAYVQAALILVQMAAMITKHVLEEKRNSHTSELEGKKHQSQKTKRKQDGFVKEMKKQQESILDMCKALRKMMNNNRDAGRLT